MNKAEQLIKNLQEATKLVDTTFIPSESGPCKIWMEGKNKWKTARDRREKAIDAILEYVPEPFTVSPEIIERAALQLCSSSTHTMCWEKLPEYYKQDFRDEAKDVLEYALEGAVISDKPTSLNEDRITSEQYSSLRKEYMDLLKQEQNYQKDIRLLKQSLEEMTMLIEKIYAEITNKNMDLLVLTNEHAAQIKKAKELVNKGIYE